MTRALRGRLDAALSPHTLTPAIVAAIDRALVDYAKPTLSPAEWNRRRQTLHAAAKAAEELLKRLDAMESTWGAVPHDRRGIFIYELHGALRREAEACCRQWRAWLPGPQRARGTNPRGDARRSLMLAVVWALDGAGVPLALSRHRREPVQEALAVVLAEADRLDGKQARPRMDLYRDAKRAVQRAITINELYESGAFDDLWRRARRRGQST